ncbi:MAG: alanine-tRNA synthetase second additional domain-containing protein [Defluviitaleaceae bacterium]|nr:alanine-tRNA synthetase second additional domain-containing protein [Defluviitaleaceae bacterium]MCL2273595.1 alanine-tRNA synthetase second additional domain-containing protein [Defluviitaleaceae bacterium]
MLKKTFMQEFMLSTVYLAPRGNDRMMILGEEITQRHLSINDRLIGIVGDAGSGKSSLIKGMFPGLELSNHDDGINPAKIMQIRDPIDAMETAGTFHIDMRFQTAFVQMHEIVTFVRTALTRQRRIIVEHFDLLYPHLDMNAEILVGIGEEIIIARPTVFGPLPLDIHSIVYPSAKYRKMAHTAEDITMLVIQKEYGMPRNWDNADVRKGFVMVFNNPPNVSAPELNALEARVREIIEADLPVSYVNEEFIKIGDDHIKCAGPRIHCRSTGEIENFRLMKEIYPDPLRGVYLLVGLVGEHSGLSLSNLNKLSAF